MVIRNYGLDKQEKFNVNLADPNVSKKLDAYKLKIGLPLLCPLNDEEIKEFENQM